MSARILARVKRNQIEPGTATRIEAGPGAICLVRLGDEFYAIGDRCSHADVSLAEGEIDAGECSIECWKHGSAFSLVDGAPQSLPATKPVPAYDTAVDGDDIVISERTAR